jgi:hypothetical protein
MRDLPIGVRCLSFVANLKILMRKKLDRAVARVENAATLKEGFPSGQRDQTVNLTSTTSKVRILLPPPF